MRWMPWNRAPSPKELRRGPRRALQPELLEPRLALSHAPLTDYGPGPGQDAGNPSAAFYGAPLSNSTPANGPPVSNGAALSSGAPASNMGPQFGGASAPGSTQPPNDSCSGASLIEPVGFGGPDGQGATGYGQSPPSLDESQDDATRIVGGAPALSFGVSPALVVNSCSVSSSSAVVYNVVSTGGSGFSSSLVVVVGGVSSSTGPVGGPSYAPPAMDEPAPVAAPSYVAASSMGAAHSAVAGAVGVSNASSALTFGLPGGSQPSAAQISQVVVSAPTTTVESPKAIVPNPSALGVLPGDMVYRNPAAEPLNALSISPLQESPRVDHQYPPAPVRQYETSQSLADTRESSGIELKSAAAPLATGGTAIAGMAPNFDALDRALEVALDEIEKMGGDLVVWLDEPDNMAWAAGGAVVLLASGGYYWQRRRAAQRTEGNPEELSSWLFTHLYNPTGRP